MPAPKKPSEEVHFRPLAFEFKRLLDSGEAKNRAEIARRYRLSRARVTQVMALFNLPDAVIEELSALMYDEKAQFRERHLRQLRALPPEQQGEALLSVLGRGGPKR